MRCWWSLRKNVASTTFSRSIAVALVPTGPRAARVFECFPSASVDSVISIRNLHKTYASGFVALKNINLDIARGEIFALLGPNGAGKTTLIGVVCGIVNAT